MTDFPLWFDPLVGVLVIPLLLMGLYHHVSVTHGRLAILAQRLKLPERISDLASISAAMLVPCLCFIIVGAFAASRHGQG